MESLMSLTLWVLLGFLPQNTLAQHVTLSPSGVAEINRFLSDAIQQGEIPAVEAIVVSKDTVLYHEVFGKRNAGRNLELQRGDLFDVASMTKPVTAAAVMMLYDEGKLDLDDPVSRYLTAFEDLEVMTSFNEEDTTYTSTLPMNPITIRHLLTHTSGMGYPFLHEPLQRLAEKLGDVGFLYDYMRFPLLYEPGAGWSYGISSRVLGALVEKVSGQRLDEFFARRIFSPLGMHDTFYEIPEEKLDRRVTVQVRENGVWVEQPLPEQHEPPIIGDAALMSTGGDYARFLRMLLNGGTLDGTRILSERSVELMTRNQIGELVVQELFNDFPVGAGRDKFGFGFQIASSVPESNSRAAGSYSWAGSNNTFFWVDPEREIAVVLLMQYLPFHDETVQIVYAGFEQRVYDSLN